MTVRIGGSVILVTGGSGFLGSHVVSRLEEADAVVYSVSRQTGYDLRNEKDAMAAVLAFSPDIVIHLAATVGGIGANMVSPGTFFRDNMKMGMSVVEACSVAKVKLVTVGTVCSFPKIVPIPFKEEDFWSGFPEETNAPYGIAKKALFVMCQAYRKEFGLRYSYLVPTNLYGPRDQFDDKVSHVIPAMIKRFVQAKEKNLPETVCWGTGKASRSFLYAADCADAIIRAVDGVDYHDIVNLPGSEEITMFDLAQMVARLVGYTGAIRWDSTKPDGQPRRAIDGTRARKVLGWEPSTPLEKGVRATIEWYLRNRT